MSRTMAHELVGDVMVVRHTDKPPSPADWQEFVAGLEAAAVTKLVVWSPGNASLSSEQRSDCVRVFRAKGKAFRCAAMTPSRIARGAATAVGWFGIGVKGFSPEDLDGACRFLQLGPDEWRGLAAVLERLGKHLAPGAATG